MARHLSDVPGPTDRPSPEFTLEGGLARRLLGHAAPVWSSHVPERLATMDPLQIGDMPPLDADKPLATTPAALCMLLAPMRIEAAALRRGLPEDTGGLTVRAAGVGFRRARRAAAAAEVAGSHAV